MKKILLLTLFLSFVGCGDGTRYISSKEYVPVDKTEYVSQEFEGLYFFEYGGQLELIADSYNRIHIVRENQYIQTVNPNNGTIAGHPTLSSNGLVPKNGVIIWTVNVNYGDGSRYDIEEDSNNSNVTGTRRTDFEIKLLDNDKISLNIKIYDSSINNNVNYIVVNRTIVSQ